MATDESSQAPGSWPEGGAAGSDQRGPAYVIDLERLEKHAGQLYLTRFVKYVKQLREEHGRFLALRAGDEVAIKAAGDGSEEYLEEVIADPEADLGADTSRRREGEEE